MRVIDLSASTGGQLGKDRSLYSVQKFAEKFLALSEAEVVLGD